MSVRRPQRGQFSPGQCTPTGALVPTGRHGAVHAAGKSLITAASTPKEGNAAIKLRWPHIAEGLREFHERPMSEQRAGVRAARRLSSQSAGSSTIVENSARSAVGRSTSLRRQYRESLHKTNCPEDSLGNVAAADAPAGHRKHRSLATDQLDATTRSAGSCHSFLTSFAAEPNSQYRPYMEDVSVIIDPFGEGALGHEESWSYFGVYDGHGGRQAAEYCEATLHKIVLNELRAKLQSGRALTDDEVAQALGGAFQRVDDQLRLGGSWNYGCTATVVLTRRTRHGVRLHVANVGDSRGVLVDVKHGSEVRLTRDHRPTDINEIDRIESEGGFVARGRVGGQLGVSRALGDHSLKAAGVTCKPSTCAHDTKHDTAFVLASDGLWDVLSDRDARVVVEQSLSRDRQNAAQLLISTALRRGSTDNIICLVVFLDA